MSINYKMSSQSSQSSQTQTLSITRALVELKTLDARIHKTIQNEWTIMKTKHKNAHVQEDEFRKDALSSYQSVMDLIHRRNRIKTAIAVSNANTMVTIGKREMSVAQAIDYKNVIEYKKKLLEELRRQRNDVVCDYENYKERLSRRIEENVKIICGRDAKPDANVITSVTDTLTKSDPVEIFDPLSIDKLIKELDDEILEFTSNIDFVLSESNALTTIVA